MVSIIIPVYNVENYLDKCLDSIVNQTFRDIEIILIDDGSTDLSKNKCLEWLEKDERIVYVRKKNEGQGEARNLGVSISKGDYITFVDSDDWIEEDCIELMHKSAKEYGVDIVVSDINYVLKDSNYNFINIVSKLRMESDKILYSKENTKLIDVARVGLWGKMYRREFYIDSGVRQPNHPYEDCATVPFLIAKANTIYHVPKALYNYFRSRPDSTVNNLDYVIELKKSLIKTKNYFKSEGIFDKYYEALMKICHAQIRFVYKKLLGEKDEIPLENKWIMDELYDFMDEYYPDWIKIDKYSIGINSDEKIRAAVEKMVFNNSRVRSYEKIESVMSKDILIINLVDDIYNQDIQLWKKRCEEDLVYIENNFKGQNIIVVRFFDESLKEEERKLIDEIYLKYKKSKLDVSILDFYYNQDKFDEGLEWDLSDELLKSLQDNFRRKNSDKNFSSSTNI